MRWLIAGVELDGVVKYWVTMGTTVGEGTRAVGACEGKAWR